MEISQLENKNRDELVAIAKEMGIPNYTSLKKQDIIMRLLQAHAKQQGNTAVLMTLPLPVLTIALFLI